MQNLKLKLTPQEVRAIYTLLHQAISVDFAVQKIEDKLLLLLLKELYLKVRTKVENGQKNLTLKPVHALALQQWFGAFNTYSYEEIVMNQLTVIVHQKFI
jgi:hypothetical protein